LLVSKEWALYVVCVAGALPHRDYLQLIKEAGFEDVEVVETKPIELPNDVLAAHMDAKRLCSPMLSSPRGRTAPLVLLANWT
jgi:hypothetical protein